MFVDSLFLSPSSAAGSVFRSPHRAAPAGYSNPLPVELADPSVLRHDGVYYLYATSAPSEGFKVWFSSDLIHWQYHSLAFRKTTTSWARDHFWAPCVIERDGAFYLFYNAVGPVSGKHCSHRICLARSDSPLGPFVDVKAPFLDLGHAVIDADAFIDADGRAYLYYSKDISENPVSEIFVVPLSDDLLTITGEPVHCLRPSHGWEGDQWNEAPCVFRHGDTYLMTYSARCFSDPLYGVGYATAPSPLGPWRKGPNNPILRRTDSVSGPGHNCVTTSPDGRELLILYHTHRSPLGGCDRQLAMDRLVVVPQAAGQSSQTPVRLYTDGPTRNWRPAPSNTRNLAELAKAG
jgi:GH43 family beta-xylosidase